MTDFHFLEGLAGKIKSNREQLSDVEDKLSDLNAKIHEFPLKSSTKATFARMIGMEYQDELASLETEKEKLVAERDILTDAIHNDMATFITELTSSDLVIPLDPSPQISEGNTIYKYKNGAKFNNIFNILSELLGLSAPLVVKDVMLSPSEIVVKVTYEFEAKKKFINSISEVQKTLSIKKR